MRTKRYLVSTPVTCPFARPLCLLLVLAMISACDSIRPSNATSIAASGSDFGDSPTISPALPSTELVLAPTDPSAIGSEWLEQARTMLEIRLEAALTGTFTIRITEGQILVEVADPDDVAYVQQLLTQPHPTILFAADEPYSAGAAVPQDVMPLMNGGNMIGAKAEALPSGEWTVQMRLTSTGGRILDTFARANVGRFLVIAQDDVVILSARIVTPGEEAQGIQVTDTWVEIRSTLNESAAKELAIQLNKSALPYALELLEIRQ